MVIYIEREREWGLGGGRQRQKENPKQALCYQRRARGNAQTHEPRDHDLS